jgi:hypothetical protein
MLLAALSLLLPLPIPFTNSFPAWAILLMAGGILLERDGLFIPRRLRGVRGRGCFILSSSARRRRSWWRHCCSGSGPEPDQS